MVTAVSVRVVEEKSTMISRIASASVLTLGTVLALPAMAGTQTFDSVLVSPTQAAGAWYTDRYAPDGFESDFFDGDYRLKITIGQNGWVENRPNDMKSSFRSTQGRKFDTNLVGSVQRFSIDLYVPSSWADNDQTAYTGLWGTAVDSNGDTSNYPIIAWGSGDYGSGNYYSSMNNGAGFYRWDGGTQSFIDTTSYSFNAGGWNELAFDLVVGSGFEFFINGTSVGTLADSTSQSLKNVILNSGNHDFFNTGEGYEYDIYYDNFSASAVPTPGAATAGALLLGALGGTKVMRRRRNA